MKLTIVWMQRAILFDTSIVIDYEGDPNDPSRRQTITFDGCLFEDLPFGESLVTFQETYDLIVALSPLVQVLSDANTLIVRNSVFRNNIHQEGAVSSGMNSVCLSFAVRVVSLTLFFDLFKFQRYPGSIIASLGAEVLIEDSCFDQNYLVNNRLRDYSATILLLGDDSAPNSISSSNNYAQKRVPPNFVSYEECLFLGRLPSTGGLICLAHNAEAAECLSSMKDVTVDW